MTDLATVGMMAALWAVAALVVVLLLASYIALSDLFARRKEGVARHEVLHHVPWAFRTFVDWRTLAWNLPKVLAAGALAGAVLTIFGVGLLEVLG